MLRKKKKKERIGRYDLDKTLGQGSHSIVRSGQNRETGEIIAIKILDKSGLAETNAEQSVMDEIDCMARLRHPNIVNITEVLSDKDKIYLVMENVACGNLYNRITRQGPMKEAEAQQVFRQLLDGVEFCHANGVFHRDIKASNALIASDGSVKLADFGLSTIKHEISAAEEDETALLTNFCGTVDCAAPELFRREEFKGGPADIWSLGVLLYFLTAGRPAFAAHSISGLLYDINRANIHIPIWMSRDLISFLRRMLCPNPLLRATIEELREHPWLGLNNEKPSDEILTTDSTIDVDGVLGNLAIADNPTLPHLAGNSSRQNLSPDRRTLIPVGKRALSPASPVSPRLPNESMNAFELMASALDISSILDKSAASVLKKCHFTSRASTETIWDTLQMITEEENAVLKIESPWRGRIWCTKAQKSSIVVDIAVEIATIQVGLVIVSFGRNSGSQKAFTSLFNTVVNNPSCASIIEGASLPSGVISETSSASNSTHSSPNTTFDRRFATESSLFRRSLVAAKLNKS